MSNKVLVHCKNTDQILEINEGDSLLQIYGQSGVELHIKCSVHESIIKPRILIIEYFVLKI